MLLAAWRLEAIRREEEQAAKYNQKPKVGFGSQIRNSFPSPGPARQGLRTGYTIGNFTVCSTATSAFSGCLFALAGPELREGARVACCSSRQATA